MCSDIFSKCIDKLLTVPVVYLM